jgi:hypothetical protein
MGVLTKRQQGARVVSVGWAWTHRDEQEYNSMGDRAIKEMGHTPANQTLPVSVFTLWAKERPRPNSLVIVSWYPYDHLTMGANMTCEYYLMEFEVGQGKRYRFYNHDQDYDDEMAPDMWAYLPGNLYIHDGLYVHEMAYSDE